MRVHQNIYVYFFFKFYNCICLFYYVKQTVLKFRLFVKQKVNVIEYCVYIIYVS